jgi:hypothetical protein
MGSGHSLGCGCCTIHRTSRARERPNCGGNVPSDYEEDRAENYRHTAERLRQLAAKVRFNFGRQQQLLSLADAFDRLAERIELE